MAETKIVANRISQTVEFSFSELSLGNGTVALPALAWASDQDTGLYRGGSNFISVSCGGSDMASFAGIGAGAALLPGIDNTYELGSEAIGWKRLFMMDGTSALPAFTFRNDANTGLYRPSADELSLSTGGSERVRIKNAGLEIRSGVIEATDGTAALPAYSFANDTNLGLYRIGTDEMGVAAAGGNLLFRFGFAGGLQTLFRGGTSAGLPGLALGEASGVGFYRISGLDKMGVSAPFAISDGTAADPSYTFANDLNTGIYRPGGADEIGIATGGSQAFMADGSYVYSRRPHLHIDGTALAPAISFSSDSDSGFFHHASNGIGVSLDGAIKWRFLPSGILVSEAAGSYIHSNGGSAATPGFAFDTDTDTGIYRAGSDQVGIAGNGVQVAVFNPTVDANMLTLNQSYPTGTVYALSANNTATGNANADIRVNLGVNDGSAGDPYLLFAIGGPTTYWSIGVDNSNSDVLAFSRTAGGTAKPGTGDIALLTNNNIQLIDGTAPNPSYTFINDSDTGLYRPTTNSMAVTNGGNEKWRFLPAGGFRPVTYNTSFHDGGFGERVIQNQSTSVDYGMGGDFIGFVFVQTFNGVNTAHGSKLFWVASSATELSFTQIASQGPQAGLITVTNPSGMTLRVALGATGTSNNGVMFMRINYEAG